MALGLASGFLEPLESTSIHLVMSGMYKLLEHFPDLSFAPATIASYNAELIREMDAIRDFIILHYCLTARDDTPFWTYCRTMKLPDSLSQRIELYRRTGRIRPEARELFTDMSWFYVFDGMGVKPERYDPLLDIVTGEQLRALFGSLSQSVAALTQPPRPRHEQLLYRGIRQQRGGRLHDRAMNGPLLAGASEMGGTKCVCLIGTGHDDIHAQHSIADRQ